MARTDEGDGLDLEALVTECLERYPDEGAAAVDEVCARHPDAADALHRRLASLERFALLDDPRPVPDAIGPYAIQRRLAEGGMSVVYLARDPRLGRNVALKATHRPLGVGERARARFEREIRAVAQLEHPCIVSVYDVGEVDGLSYFTMEYVEGATLARVIEALREEGADFERLSGESVRRITLEAVDDEALAARWAGNAAGAWGATYVETVCRLVLDVADALAHAHRHEIVHRDVKPSNVLVRRDGRAKLFDLGLARLADQPALTRSGDFAGTPYYVSPEQLAGRRVDPRSDVYSLGVTLYELLTLRRPFEGRSTAQVFRQIQTREPVPPRRVNPLVPRDLETICLAAIEKEPQRRYPSADALAGDLRRFLAFEPVHAQPVGALRRAWRMGRRNPGLGVAAALAALLVVGLPVGLLWANAAIRRQRDLAEEAASEARRQAHLSAEVTEYLVELFELTDDDVADGRTVTAREILDRGVARLPADFDDEPRVRAALMQAAGRVYANLGLHAEALPLLDRSFSILQRELGEFDPEVASVLHLLATVHLRAGNLEASAALGRRALDSFARAGEARAPAAAACAVTVAEAAERLGDAEGSRALLERALAILEHAGEDAAAAGVLERLGVLARERGDLPVASASLERSVEMRRRQWHPDPRGLAGALELLAGVCEARGEPERAATLRREARGYETSAALDERRLAGTPLGARGTPSGAVDPALPYAFEAPWAADFERSFQSGITALQAGEHDAAIAAFERCLEWRPHHPACAYNIACGHALAGRTDLALEWLARAADDGIASRADAIGAAENDGDLAALRSHPRSQAIFERIRAQRERWRAFAAEPARYLPPGPGTPETWALVVVLHDEGRTKRDVVDGPWRAVADELGFALLAPSAPRPVAGEAERGMSWFEDVGEFLERPWSAEEPVVDAVRAFAEAHAVDRERVYLVGEGAAGLIAFDLALRAPGFFRGVLLVDGAVHPASAHGRAETAASLGLDVRFLFRRDARVPWLLPGITLDELVAALRAWLPSAGLRDAEIVVEDDAASPAALVRALRPWLEDDGARR